VVILHVLDHSMPVMSGYSTRSRSIVTFQKALGLTPVVLTSPKHGPTGSSVDVHDGIPHHRTAPDSNGVRYVGEVGLMIRMARRIGAVARAENVDVIHAHSPLLNGLPALWAGRRLGLPVVYEARAFWEDAAVDHGTMRERSLRYRLSRALETFLFRRADRVVVIADAMRREIIARGVATERLSVIPNAVDIERFRPVPRDTELARRLGLEPGPVLGFIGSFYRYEGLRFLIDAMPALRRQIPGCQLLLVGAGEDEEALRSRAAEVGPGVILTGQIPHSQISDFYSIIDVFVCPRRRMRLTELVTPLKPLEAMAMGCPVVASDVGGLLELIQHEVTGLIFKAESQAALVGEVRRVASDPAFRTSLGAAGRAHVERERTWAGVVSRYRAIYEAVGPCATVARA
jgi:glycogen synthase